MTVSEGVDLFQASASSVSNRGAPRKRKVEAVEEETT